MSKTKAFYEETRDESRDYANWVENWRFTEGAKYITCIRRINWQGDCVMSYDVHYRILKKNFTTPKQMIDDVWQGSIPRHKTIFKQEQT